MEYLILAVIVVVLVSIGYSLNKNSHKTLHSIRDAWGKSKNEYFDFGSIRRYADKVKGNRFHRLSEQTMNDIDLEGVFAFIDRTTSRIGQQFLYRKLIEPVHTHIDAAEKIISLFSENISLREKVQVQLARLNHPDAYTVVSLLGGDQIQSPRWFNFLYLDLFLVILLIAFSSAFPFLLIILIIPVTLNMVLHYWNKGKSIQYVRSFPQLNVLIDVSKNISILHKEFDSPLVRQSIMEMYSFQSNSLLLNLTNRGGWRDELSQVFMYFVELIKAIFLVEVFALYRLTRAIENKRDSIYFLFDYVGGIDSAISITSMRAGDKKVCIPDFISGRKEIKVTNMYHPLVRGCIKNSLTIQGKSILITGSNMSGKSTFLRTMMINSILGQTFNTCFADEFHSPFLKQFSLIRIDDDLYEGRSYSFEEVKQMGHLLDQVDNKNQNLFVLDELFKGTNTIERIASARALLSYLNQNDNIVIASTHDIELAGMLTTGFELYHFSESVENDELCFDYRIKPGQLKTRNAIKILELSGYPKVITDEAREVVSLMLKTNQI